MWTCTCGCKGIAESLGYCPMCEKEREMAKVTGSGPSNARAEPGEPGYMPGEDEQPENAREPVPEPVPEPAAEDAEPAVEISPADDKPDYASLPVKDLVELCKARGVPFSGPAGTLPKADLILRLEASE